MVRLADHERPDGTIDWDGLNRAEVQNGVRCRCCGCYMLFGLGHPRACHQCADLTAQRDKPIVHDYLVRCPGCGHQFEPTIEELARQGREAELVCHRCDRSFSVAVKVSMSYESPPMEPDNA